MLKSNIIHKSLYRPNLFVGCERLPFTILIIICGTLIMTYQNLYNFCFTFFFYLTCVIFIRRINEYDQQFFECMTRYIFYYQEYYPANASYPGKSHNIFFIKDKTHEF